LEPFLFWSVMALTAALSVLCSVAEGALHTYSAARLEELLKDPERRSCAEPYLPRLDSFMFTSATINACSDMLVVAVAAIVASRAGGFGTAPAIAGAVVLVLLLGELLPRVLGIRYADRLLLRVLRFVSALEVVFLPVVWPLRKVHEAMLGLASGGDAANRRADELIDELRSAAVEGEREGVLDERDAEMIESIIEYRNVEVREIMTPRTDMVSVGIGATIREAVELFVSSGHSRIPVYDGTRDNIRGVLYAKDVLAMLAAEGERSAAEAIGQHVRPPYFVPETKAVGSLLQEFRTRKVHLAVVLDEYGGTAGLVSIEDILEEIVGEIEDEYDQNPFTRPSFQRVGPTAVEVDARLRIDEVNEELDLELPEEGEYETLGGLVMFLLGKVPAKGETTTCEGVRLTVVEADERHVTRVRLDRAQSAQTAA
jgi:CBS domain containing-hemolysin-like protein